jgi:hypothetical protein
MARSLGTLTVDLVAKIGGFQQGMDKAARESEKSLNRIRKAAGGIGTAITAGLAFLGGAGLFRAIVQNTTEAEDALRQLEARLKSTGGVAGVTSDQLQDNAAALQQVTTYGDDAIVSMNALLLTFTNIRGQQVFGATEAILDLATAMGTDLNSAALQVGKALNDPVKGISALGRAGIQFSEDQKKVIKSLVETGDIAGAQNLILREMQVQFGGAARAAADTFGGALTQLQNAMGDLLEVNGGGLNDATDAVKEFTAALNSPQIKEGAQSFASGLLTAVTTLTTKVFELAGGVKVLSENFAAARYGAAADDLVRLNEQLALATELRAAGPTTILEGGAFFDRLRFFGKDGLVEWYDDAELDAEIKKLKQQIEEGTANVRPPILAPSAPTPAGAGSGGETPTEEFEKLSGQLQQQIALYGQVGEAAKIRYQIESGALDDLTSTEQQRLLGLAKQYDSLVAQADAAKELAKAQKEQQQAQEQIDKAYESQLLNYQQQIELTGEITELQRLRFEIERGGLQGVSADQASYLEGLAAEIDAKKERNALDERGAAITASVSTPQEDYAASITELNLLLREGAIEQETYARAVKAAQDEVIAATTATKDALSVFKDEALRNSQGLIADTFRDIRDGASVTTESVLSSFTKMLSDIAFEIVAADIAGKLFGTTTSSSSSSGGGWIDALAGLAGAFAGGYANGGTMGPGQWGIVGENGPELAFSGSKPLSIQPMASSGPQVVQNFMLQAPQGTVSRQTQVQIGAQAAKGLQQANRRNN